MAFFTHMLGRAAEARAMPPVARRALFRRLGGAGLAAVGVNLALADRSWAAVEERARYFGIEPGTLVDARGRPLKESEVAGDTPCLGQLMPAGFNFAPRMFAFCDGQLLPISQYTALFSLLGTTYGGDGRTTFALPDLRSRSPMHMGRGNGLSQRNLGARGGEETVTLTVNQLPSHNHGYEISTTTTPTTPNNVVIARNFNSTADTSLPNSVGSTGGSQPHDNMAPFLVLNFCIALQGIFPSRG